MSYKPEELRRLIGTIPKDSDYRPKLIKKYESMVLGKDGDDLTSLTLCAGLIPNENSVVLLQDSLGIIPRTGQQRSLETKIRDINSHAFFGIAGDPYFANELSDRMYGHDFDNEEDFKKFIKKSYNDLHLEKVMDEFLLYFFNDEDYFRGLFEANKLPPALDAEYKARINDAAGERPDIMVISNISKPVIYKVGVGTIKPEYNVMERLSTGSASAPFETFMGEHKYRLNRTGKFKLSTLEGIETLLRVADPTSRATSTIGPPFDIVYVERTLKQDANLYEGEKFDFEAVRLDKIKLEEVRRAIREEPDVSSKVLCSWLEMVKDSKVKKQDLKKTIRKKINFKDSD